MKPEDILRAKLTISGYFMTHALIDIMLEGLDSDKEDVELWSLNCLRELGKLRKKQHAAKLTDYELMFDYIMFLEKASGA